MTTYTYLALGDSYTIGESISLQHSFPYQVVSLLRKMGHPFSAPEMIAKTGWTTHELLAAMEGYTFLPKYNFITLCIGVNNQYRKGSVEEYKVDLERLLKKSIQLADHKNEHVILLSIPDYSITPFAAPLNPDETRKALDLFNSVGKALSLQYKVRYADIAPGTRAAGEDISLLADDGLHPSMKEYKKWAEEVSALAANFLKK